LRPKHIGNTPDAKPSLGVLRPEILEVAKETFAKKGYVASSLRDIAEQAGVTAAAIYYHYAKKEDLLREIIFDCLDRLSRDVVSALSTAANPIEALESVVRAHLRFNMDYSRESKIIIEDCRFLNEVDYAVVREKQNGILNIYRACIRELTASGLIGEVDPTITAFNMVSIVLGWYRWFRPEGRVSAQDAFEYTVRFAMAAVINVKPVGPKPNNSTGGN